MVFFKKKCHWRRKWEMHEKTAEKSITFAGETHTPLFTFNSSLLTFYS